MHLSNIFMSALSSAVIVTCSFANVFPDKQIASPIVLVNNNSMISEAYVPEIEKARISGGEKMLRVDALKSAETMFDAAKADGVKLNSLSSYRSYGTQKLIFSRKLKLNDGNLDAAKDYVALPGASEHQLGLAIDIVGTNIHLNYQFAETTEGKWLADNSYKYGFIVRYPKEFEKVTGILYEPWHIRYVGLEAAKQMHDDGIPLEKYVSIKRMEKYKELLTIR